MRVYIIGLPGTGKTFFGRMLAKTLKLQVFDLDECVEKKEKLTIKEIIQQKGEPYFREKEEEVLKQVSQNGHCVIACGGGTPLFFSNLELMKSQGIVVWLNTDLEIISRRIAHNITRRPLFIGLSEPEILVKLKELIEKRKKYYSKADVFIDGNLSHVNSLNSVIQKIMRISQRRFR